MQQTLPEKKEKVLMPEEDKTLLKELYLKRSYSGNEEVIRQVITSFLDKLKIPYVNFNGNILGFNYPGAPLFSAHMDMVNTERYKLAPNETEVGNDYVFTIDSKTNIRLYRDRDKKHQTSLGADDKNGVWAILTMLKMKKKINFAFCHSEEVGAIGSKQIVQDEESAKFIESCRYCIVIDRRNAGDIIGYSNKYCMGLDDRLAHFSKEQGFNFVPERGSMSDADQFSQLVECVNLSCGYYEAHTSNEYTNLNELWNTLLFCLQIVDGFNYNSVSPERIRDFKDIKTAPYTIEKQVVKEIKEVKEESSTYYPKYNSYTQSFYSKNSEKKKSRRRR